jgi:DNA-binding MarR family transcriptional regulator
LSIADTAEIKTLTSEELDELLDQFDLTASVTHLLRRAHSRGDDLFAEIMCSGDLTPRQMALLVASYQNRGATVVELGAAIAVDRNTVAEMISRLVDTGLLRRERSDRDRRAWSIYITGAGVDVLRRVLPHNDRLMETVLEPLPLEYRPLFVKCLRLMAGLEENPASHTG